MGGVAALKQATGCDFWLHPADQPLVTQAPEHAARWGLPFGEAPDFAARTGFESELLWLLTELDRADVTNLVFVATDVHFPAQIRYEPDLDQDGDRLRFFELISGPLSAVRLPSPATLDSTLRPVYLYAEGDVFNFAYVRLVGGGPETLPRLLTDVRDETGRVRPGSELVIEPETGTAAGSP